MEALVDDRQVAAAAERDGSIGGIVLARQGLAQQVRDLSQVDDWRFVSDVVRQWVIIGLATAAAVWSHHWAVYACAILINATRQHALGILMHDGTHFRLLSNRALNDAVCDLFCAFPVGMATSRYRYEHLLHHRFLNTDGDPYWVEFKRDDTWHWPKTVRQAIWVFIRDVTGLNSARWLPVQYRWSPWINHFSTQSTPPPLTKAERVRLYGFLVVVLSVATLTNGWLQLFLLWLLPISTITPALVRLRTICEHLAIPSRDELDASRHTDGTLFERLTVAPFNINYHVDHHLFPAVPYYNLPKLHTLLLKNPNYTDHAILNRTYFGLGKGGLLGEIITRR